MEDIPISNHNLHTTELLTIEENYPKNISKRNNYRRLYTFNAAKTNSFFTIKKLNKNNPITEDIFSFKLKPTSPNPTKQINRKSDSKLNYYLFNTINKKSKYLLSPAISKTEKENEKVDEKLNNKIKELYLRYQKTYENNSMENIGRNKNKQILNLNNKADDTKIESENKNYSVKKLNNNYKSNRNNNFSKLKSKTVEKHNVNKISYNSPKIRKRNNFSYRNNTNIISYKNNIKRKTNNNRYRTCLTEGNKNKNSILKLKKSDSFLHTKVTNLIKELNLKKNSDFYIFKQDENADNSHKMIKIKTKDARGKLVNLLNRPGESINDENIKYFSKKKIQRNENPILIRKPTNNIEMNNLIINSFGAGYNHNEFSKKMFNLNETFFMLLENMKQRRAEIDIAKFEKEKNKYIKKGFQKKNYDAYFHKNRDKWEKKFMHDQYQYRIPEKEFRQFKKSKQIQMKKQIIKDSEKLSQLLTNMDAEEYEFPDTNSKLYKSTKNSISIKNVKRIYRVNKILKTIEDEEQTGKIIIDANKLKKEQRIIQSEIISAIGRSGKPRFVKSLFKPKTIRKYKGISGNYFGLPT